MKRFLLYQRSQLARPSAHRGAAVADVVVKPLLPFRMPTPMAKSSSAFLTCTLLGSLALLAIPPVLSTRAAAQEPAAEATATQIDSKVGDIEVLLGQGEEGRPPRPAPSDTRPHSPSRQPASTQPENLQSDWVSDARAIMGSSSSSDAAKTRKEGLEENHELSVEPGTPQMLPDDAPAWVGSLPDLTDDDHRLFVGGHIAESASEAAEGLDTPLVAAVNQYIDAHLLQRKGAARSLSGKITADYIWKNLIDERTGYTARLNTPGQPMFQKWVTVSITPEQRAAILRWDREALQRERLAPIGLGLVSLLGGVGLLHLILRRGNR
ncbi:MAG: hypothetical protein IT422_18320 [Pirellulaceae bacterium]|nr:hypothetical protein [Pirellulaceae bacterium]